MLRPIRDAMTWKFKIKPDSQTKNILKNGGKYKPPVSPALMPCLHIQRR